MHAALFFITLFYLAIASAIDLKKNEVPDWLSFSLLFITWSFVIIEAGVKGLSVLLVAALSYILFFVLANILYYTGTFGGGDYKLLIAMAPAIAYPLNFLLNLLLFASAYGLFFAFLIFARNAKSFKLKEQLDASFFFFTAFCLLLFILSLAIIKLPFVAALFLILPILFVVVRFSDKACIKEIKTKEVVPGDVIVEKIRIGGREIMPKVGGLTEEEVILIRKHKRKIKVKVGIPFVPVFFLTYAFSSINLIQAMVSALL
jgi:Flp pilus assembly protein protease CpaA